MITSERIKRIIAYIMDTETSDTSPPDITYSELVEMGYSQEEISEALHMLDLEPSTDRTVISREFGSRIRVLGEPEKLILSTQAQGYLIKLHRLGSLTESQINLIIENAALECTPPVSIDEIRDIATRYASEVPDSRAPEITGGNGQVH